MLFSRAKYRERQREVLIGGEISQNILNNNNAKIESRATPLTPLPPPEPNQ